MGTHWGGEREGAHLGGEGAQLGGGRRVLIWGGGEREHLSKLGHLVKGVKYTHFQLKLNPLTPFDQGEISPNNISTISSGQVMRIKKMINKEITFNWPRSSQNYHLQKSIADSEKDCCQGLGSEKVKLIYYQCSYLLSKLFQSC